MFKETRTGDYWGCSLSYYSSIAHKYGYSLLQVELLEATFIRTENIYLFDGTICFTFFIWWTKDPGSDYDQWFKNFYSHSFSQDYVKTLNNIDKGVLHEWATKQNSYLLYESINATLGGEQRLDYSWLNLRL